MDIKVSPPRGVLGDVPEHRLRSWEKIIGDSRRERVRTGTDFGQLTANFG
jgi:hypothetical protein